MIMNDMFRQLALQSPMLLVLLIGLVLSLIFIRRAPKPAFMAAGACIVLLVTTFANLIASEILVNSRLTGTISMEAYSWIFTIISVLSACIRAAAIGLLIAAVFVGRARLTAASSFPVIPNTP